MRLYLVRHGETDWNMRDLMQGWSDIPLNSTGLAQAEFLRSIIAKYGLEFNAIYSSPLQRTRKTAEIMAGTDQQVIIEPRLLERGDGEFEGRPCSLFFDSPINFLDPDLNSSAYGVEPILDFSYRISTFLTEVSYSYPDDARLLIVASNGVMKRTHILITGKYNPPNFKNAMIYEYELSQNTEFAVKIPPK